jgi:hypothetical protein
VKNLFCNASDLSNEASVESFFVLRLLKELGYKDNEIQTKKSIQELGYGLREEPCTDPYARFSHNPCKSIYFMVYRVPTRAKSATNHDKTNLSMMVKEDFAPGVVLRCVGPSGMPHHGVDRIARMGCPLTWHRISFFG